MFDLPPASIFAKIVEKDKALADEVFERASQLSEARIENHYRLTRQDKFKALMQGALGVFGSAPHSDILSRKNRLPDDQVLSDSFRKAVSEIVEKQNIVLTDNERDALRPFISPEPA